jgi:DNA polymerase
MLHIDFETRGTADLRKTGADRYAADPNTGVWCMAWALDDDPVELWTPGSREPAKLLEHIETGGMVAGWNVAFELAIWNHVIPRICPSWPALKVEQLDDTMARSYARACPGALHEAAKAVGIPLQKDMAGHRLMLKYCKPTLKWRKTEEGEPEWYGDEDELQRLYAYCKQDVEVERALAKRLAPLSKRERKIWLIDRAINNRGVRVHTERVQQALAITDQEKNRLTKELKELTDGHVKSANNVPSLLTWLKAHGVEIDNLKRRRVSRLLASDAIRLANDPDIVKARRALEIRLEVSKASTAKLKSMLASQDEDGRCRGLFSYHVATTGRWAGRRIQLQNFPRPTGRFDDDKTGQQEIDGCLELFAHPYAADAIRFSYDEPMRAVSNCLRGLIVPDAGKQFIGGDFTGIENRVLMWLAGEEWMLEEFRKFDAGRGVDNYKLTYSKAFNVSIDMVTGQMRLIGKVASLACGYAGAVGAFLGMGDNYDNFVAADIGRAVKASVDPDVWDEAEAKYPKQEKWRFGLDLQTWTGIKIVVEAWRSAHPNVVQFWWSLQDCAIEAVLEPGKVTVVKGGKIKFCANNGFLFMQLPSGRMLAYARPSVAEEPNMSGDGTRKVVKYYGVGKKSKRWEQRVLTPQIMSENAASGVARDVLTDAMIRLEEANYPISFHVHDETVSEVPIGFGSVPEYQHILCDSRPWLAGLPVAAKAWSGDKFRK